MTPSFAQDTIGPLEVVRDYDNLIVVMQSRDQLVGHTKALATDLGYGGVGDIVANLFQFDQEGEFDTRAPIVIYGGFLYPAEIVQLPIASRALVQARAGRDIDVENIFQTEDVGFDFDLLGADPRYALVKNSQLAFSEEKKLLDAYVNSPLLADSLSDPFRDLLAESGLALFSRVTDLQRPRLSIAYNDESGDFTREEIKTLELIDSAFESARHSLLGLTYHKRCVTLKGRLRFGEENPAEDLLQLNKIDRGFEPSIGLSKRNLISAVSLQLDALKSPTTARLIPKILARENWLTGNSKWIDGEMIRTAMQLLADTWHDVTGARLGLYLADGGGQGNLCIVGIVDTKDPDAVMDELRKLVVLVDPGVEEEALRQQQVEIAALIEQLDSPSYEIRERASTRLLLAGRTAIEPLSAVAETGSMEKRTRVNQLLRKLEADAELATRNFAVSSIDFWSNLRPQFSMDETTVKVGDHDGYLLRVHPDASKTPAEVTEATNVISGIFGESWNKVHMVRVDDRFVFMFGSDMLRLDEVINNLKSGRDPIGSSEIVRRQEIQPSQFQVYVSMGQIVNLYSIGRREANPVAVGDSNLTTMTVSLSPGSWGANLHMPVEELKALIDAQMNGVFR